MLYREIIAVCSQIHTKHINTVCGQNVEFVVHRSQFLVQYSTVYSAAHTAGHVKCHRSHCDVAFGSQLSLHGQSH